MSGGLDTWKEIRRGLAILAAGFLWHGAAQPAHAAPSVTPLVLSYPRTVLVLDPAQADDVGSLPVEGTVEAACLLSDRSLLIMHAPDAQALHLVDVTPLSSSRFQVLASYHSPELARRSLRFVQSGLRVYLAAGSTAVAIIDPKSYLVKLGAHAIDFLPLVADANVVMPQGLFSLVDGQLSFENPQQRGGVSAPVFIPLADRPLELLPDPANGRLCVSVSKADGSGGIVVLDASSRRVVQEIPVPWPITSMVWRKQDQLAVLSAARKRLGLYDLSTQRWMRIWSPSVPGKPLKLLALDSPATAEEVLP